MESGVADNLLIVQANVSITSRVHVTRLTPLLDDFTEYLTHIIFDIILGISISTFGIVANVTNIVIFIRQGIFSDGSSLNLFCLAVSDLGFVTTSLFNSVFNSITMADIPDLTWDPSAIIYGVTHWPNAMFTMATRLLTAYIEFERCMCVVIPFRVKALFAPHRSFIYIITVFAYSIVSHAPMYTTQHLDYKIQEGTNISKLVLIIHSNRQRIFDIVMLLNYISVSFATVIIVFTCTVITSSYIKTSKAWRNRVTKADVKPRIQHTPSTNETFTDNKQITPKPAADKEARLVRIITLVSIIYLICFTPEIAYTVANALDPRISGTGQYHRLSYLFYSLITLMGGLNSSVNIIVYYTMSSRYRNELRDLCRPSPSKGK